MSSNSSSNSCLHALGGAHNTKAAVVVATTLTKAMCWHYASNSTASQAGLHTRQCIYTIQHSSSCMQQVVCCTLCSVAAHKLINAQYRTSCNSILLEVHSKQDARVHNVKRATSSTQ
eukprot:11485-Heterococcus_DN1.PRE.1